LRRVEDFSADIRANSRKKLGIREGVSDTTFYRVLSGQRPEGFRESLQAHVRQLIKDKGITNDLMPLGVMSFDGKLLWSSTTTTVEGAKTSVDEKSGVLTASLMSVRAVLTSSLVRPCVDFEVIGDKEGEAPAFRVVFPRACKAFGDQFRIVTGDAGLACRENAQMAVDANKFYLWNLKGNQPTLEVLAEKMFANCPGGLRRREEDYRNGCLVVRELYTVTINDVDEVDMADAQQFWRVRKQTFRDGELVEEEVRDFISGIPPRLLSPTNQLKLVRLHWGIENNHNWTMDVPLLEDDVQPCQKSRDAIEVVGWLRVLGYNLLSAWRAHAGKKDRRPIPWQRCLETLRDAWLSCFEGATSATLV